MSIDQNHPAVSSLPMDFDVDNVVPVTSSEILSGDFLVPQPAPAHSLSSHSLADSLPPFQNHVDLANGTMSSIHVPPSNLTSPAFLSPPESLDAISFSSALPDFSPAFPVSPPAENGMTLELAASSHAPSLSPPGPSAGIHGPASSYGAGVTSSLQSALDPVVTPTKQRSRAGTTATPPLTLPVVNAASVAVPSINSASAPADPLGPTCDLSLGGLMLEEIVHSASAAADLCRADKGAEANRVVEGLKEKLAHVSEVISGLKDMSMNEAFDMAYPITNGGTDFPTPTSVYEPSMYFPPNTLQLPHSHGSEPHIDLTRKRCDSHMDDRPAKQPRIKTEPQDESPVPSNSGFSPLANMSHGIHSLQSPPPSRPPSPPHQFLINPMKPTTALNSPPPKHPTFRRAPWSESVVPTRHAHSQSTGSIRIASGRANSDSGFPHKAVAAVTQPGITGRMARSGSIGGSFTHPFTYPNTKSFIEVPLTWSGNGTDHEVPSSQKWNTASAPASAPLPATTTTRASTSSVSEEDGGDDDDDEDSPGSGNNFSSSAGSDVPQEYRAEVDRIFFEYLNKTCSNLDATDMKGEAIHQTLMAKKMQRLDESPDFRPFKFRIQAFTNAFLEELAKQGYPEEKIPMKKIRNYLWRQSYIQRYNEDGRKAKSKGNHIWNVEARKAGEGQWEFRPFYRKLAGSPPGVAYCGLRWQWAPRVWDPQASWQNVPVHYSSPSLPSWLSWNGDVLSGTPPLHAQSCDVTVIAKFMLDGHESQLSHSFHINVAPRSAMDPTFGRSSGDTMPRRASEPITLNQLASRLNPPPPPPAAPSASENAPARVVEVLQNVAQRVAQETELELSTHLAPMNNLNNLAKQKHVVERGLAAYDQALTGPTAPETHRMAVAAQAVVAEAAQSAVAPRAAAAGIANTPLLAISVASVGEMTDLATQALATAVKIQGPASNDLDVIETTSSLLASRHGSPARTVAPPSYTPPPPPHLPATGFV